MQTWSINHWKSWVSIACNTKWAHTVQCSPYRHAASGKAVAQNRSYQISLHRVDTLLSPSLLHNCQSGGWADSHIVARSTAETRLECCVLPSFAQCVFICWLSHFAMIWCNNILCNSAMVSIININSPTLLRNCFGCAHNRTVLHGSSILAWVLWAMPSLVPAVWRVYTRICMVDVWVCNDPCRLAEI